MLYITMGLILGMMAFYFLVMPAREKDLNSRRDSELTSYIQKLNSANGEIDKLQADYDALKQASDTVQAQLDELTTGNTSIMAQYQSLIWVLHDYRMGDMAEAAKLFAESSFDLIEDEGILSIVESIRQDMSQNVYQTLVERGLQLWNAGDKTQAMEFFQASLKIKPDNPEAIYYVGRLYQDAGDTDNANTMFDKVVNEYADSEYAERARSARGY